MVKKCIILGELKKTLCLPFIFAAVQIGHKMFTRFFYREIRPNLILNYYVTSFAMMTIIFLPCILKIKYIETDKERKIHKKKIFALCFISFYFFGLCINEDNSFYNERNSCSTSKKGN